MKVTFEIEFDELALTADECLRNVERFGIAIAQLRTMQATWDTCVKRLKEGGNNGGHNRT